MQKAVKRHLALLQAELGHLKTKLNANSYTDLAPALKRKLNFCFMTGVG